MGNSWKLVQDLQRYMKQFLVSWNSQWPAFSPPVKAVGFLFLNTALIWVNQTNENIMNATLGLRGTCSPKAQHPGLSAASLWTSTEIQQEDQLHWSNMWIWRFTRKNKPSWRTKEQSIWNYWTFCFHTVQSGEMMHWLLLLLHHNATVGVKQWHKHTTRWFTCVSHSTPAAYTIQIQIQKAHERSLIP